MTYDEWKTMTPEEWYGQHSRAVRRTQRDIDDPPPEKCWECGEPSEVQTADRPLCLECFQSEPTECPSCKEIVDTLEAEGVCRQCWKRMCVDDPPPDDDDEPDEPTDPEATPILTGDDPDEMLPDVADPPGGES